MEHCGGAGREVDYDDDTAHAGVLVDVSLCRTSPLGHGEDGHIQEETVPAEPIASTLFGQCRVEPNVR